MVRKTPKSHLFLRAAGEEERVQKLELRIQETHPIEWTLVDEELRQR